MESFDYWADPKNLSIGVRKRLRFKAHETRVLGRAYALLHRLNEQKAARADTKDVGEQFLLALRIARVHCRKWAAAALVDDARDLEQCRLEDEASTVTDEEIQRLHGTRSELESMLSDKMRLDSLMEDVRKRHSREYCAGRISKCDAEMADIAQKQATQKECIEAQREHIRTLWVQFGAVKEAFENHAIKRNLLRRDLEEAASEKDNPVSSILRSKSEEGEIEKPEGRSREDSSRTYKQAH